MFELKRIGVVSLGKIYALVGAIFGLIAGIFMAIIALSLGSVITTSPEALALDPTGMYGMIFGFGVLAIVAFPVMAAICGFILGAITALIYNLIAGKLGGVLLELNDVGGAQVQPQPQPQQLPQRQPQPPQ
jgi:hypothetical protein